MQTVLHVGCGPTDLSHLPPLFHEGEWQEVRLDIDESVEPDIVASMLDLSIIDDGVMDAVYSSHNIEHLYPHEVPVALREFLRVLKSDGVLVLKCPDIYSVAQSIVETGSLDSTIYDSPSGPIAAIDVMYGYRAAMAEGNLFMAHKTAFTSKSIAREMFDVGFRRVLVSRDIVFGMHVLAYGFEADDERLQRDLQGTLLAPEGIKETISYSS